MTLGEYLKALRHKHGFSIKQVVIKSKGVLDKASISRIEHGQRKISLNVAYVLSKIYEVNFMELVNKIVDEKDATQESFGITNEEMNLLEKFRQLSPVLRVSFKNILYTMTGAFSDLPQHEKNIPEPLKLEDLKEQVGYPVIDYQEEDKNKVE
ncbi:MAG: helix-turn-helix transcriptional regulator [bacterium]